MVRRWGGEGAGEWRKGLRLSWRERERERERKGEVLIFRDEEKEGDIISTGERERQRSDFLDSQR
jgi:hypothetical protein